MRTIFDPAAVQSIQMAYEAGLDVQVLEVSSMLEHKALKVPRIDLHGTEE